MVEDTQARVGAHVDHAFRRAEAAFEVIGEAEPCAADRVQVFVSLVDHGCSLHGRHQCLQPGEDGLRVAWSGEGLDAVLACGALFAADAVVPALAGSEAVALC